MLGRVSDEVNYDAINSRSARSQSCSANPSCHPRSTQYCSANRAISSRVGTAVVGSATLAVTLAVAFRGLAGALAFAFFTVAFSLMNSSLNVPASPNGRLLPHHIQQEHLQNTELG